MTGTPLFLVGLVVTAVVGVGLLLRAYAAILDIRTDERLELPAVRVHEVRHTPFHHT